MQSSSKKPTKEMLNEAHRLAFFSDEVLSQTILESYDNTDDYISRNRQDLTERGIIHPPKKLIEISEEEIKARKKWLNALYLKVNAVPMLLFALISWYLLATPYENWPFEINSYHEMLISLVPTAQTWSNISPVFREKMVFLYFVFYAIFFYMFLGTLLTLIKNKSMFATHFVPMKADLCEKSGMVVIGVILFAFLALFALPQGAETPLAMEQLHNARHWINRDSVRWNQTFGFVVSKLLVLGFVSYALVAIAQLVGTLKRCARQ